MTTLPPKLFVAQMTDPYLRQSLQNLQDYFAELPTASTTPPTTAAAKTAASVVASSTATPVEGPQYVCATSTGTTAVSSATSIYLALVNNSIGITAGQWQIFASGVIYTGSGIAYITKLGVYNAQGTGTSTPPTALPGTIYGLTTSLVDVNSAQSAGGPSGTIGVTNTVSFDIVVTSPTRLFVVPEVIKSSGTGATTTASIWARRIL